MVVSKAEVQSIVDSFPAEIEVEDLIHALFIREKLAAADADIAAGRLIDADEVRRRALSWR